jgi:hypothetical protein
MASRTRARPPAKAPPARKRTKPAATEIVATEPAWLTGKKRRRTTTPEVVIEPPRVLRAFLHAVAPLGQIDMLEGDELVLRNEGGVVKVTLVSGKQTVPVMLVGPTRQHWFRVELAPVWGLEPLVIPG